MIITKTIEIDMGHRIPNHNSKCKNLHGHRYKIEVGVDDKIITEAGSSSEGMVIDFGDLKKIMMIELDDKFDHGFCSFINDEYFMTFHGMQEKGMKIIFVPFIPTAENLAKHWYELIQPKLKEKDIKLLYVKVWETPTSTAVYQED